MIAYFVENQEVELGKTAFSMDFCNIRLTKQGVYSIGLTVPLDSEQNMKAYKHIDRDPLVFEGITRHIRFVVGVRQYVGVEHIESFNEADNSVSISMELSGASLTGKLSDGRKLSALNLGSIEDTEVQLWEDYDMDIVSRDFINSFYPDTNYTLAPQFAKNADNVDVQYNEYKIILFEEYFFERGMYLQLQDRDLLHKQPYFFYIVDKVFTALGYGKIKVPEELRYYYEHTYLVHNYSGELIEEMLEDITVDEFIKRIETLFSSVFFVHADGSVTLTPVFTQAKGARQCIKPENVLKTMEITYDESTGDIASISAEGKYRYKFPSEDWFKINDFEPSLMEIANIVEVPFFADIPVAAEVPFNSTTNGYYNTNTVWKVNASKMYYTLEKGPTYYRLRRVNVFGETDNQKTEEISIEITPAEMHKQNYNMSISPEVFTSSGYFYPQIPRSSQPYTTHTAPIGFYPQIFEEWKPTRAERMEIAMFEGIRKWSEETYYSEHYETELIVSLQYPNSATDVYVVYNPNILGVDSEEMLKGLEYSFRLNGPYSLRQKFIDNKLPINTAVKYVIDLIEETPLSQDDLFLINGKLYVCSKLTRDISDSELKEVIQGEFYLVGD